MRGGVLVVGGAHDDATVLSSSEVSSPSVCIGIFWAPTGSLFAARQNFSMVLLANGNILAAGGTSVTNAVTGFPAAMATAEIFNPATGRWTRTGPLRDARYNFLMVLLPNGNVLAAGGADGYTYLTSAELYNPDAGAWFSTGSLTTARFDSSIVVLANGNVLVAGGTQAGQFTTSAEVYSSKTGMWSTTGSLLESEAGLQMVLLPNGNVLAAGGIGGVTLNTPMTYAELYNVSTGVWQNTGTLVNGRFLFQMVLLPNGNVLAAGGLSGFQENDVMASAEVYNYTTATWTPTGSLATARKLFQMVVLPNGNVLAAGGVNDVAQYLNSIEVYNYTTGSWPATGTLMTARSDFQMAVF